LNKRIKDPRFALLKFIKIHKLTGSAKNRIFVVFDGYYADSLRLKQGFAEVNIIFSCQKSADEIIKDLVEKADKPGNIIVVSDDKEVKLFSRVLGAKVIGVEEFILPKAARNQPEKERECIKAELNYTQRQRINEELKKIWLK